MAETKAKKKAAVPAPRTSAEDEKTGVDRTIDLSGDVLKAVESGQRAAIEAVRKFVETVDEALPAIGDRPSRREQVVDGALELADRLVTAQYDFLRTVVRDAGHTLKGSGKQ